jgi:Flp pilus assembly protein TadD
LAGALFSLQAGTVWPAGAELTAGCGRNVAAGTMTRLGMIRKLLDGGRPYAALAHLDATGVKGEAADLLRADILRRIGQRDEAGKYYQGLLNTCLAGAGHQGLGLLAGEAGQLPASLDHLRKAGAALPADARVRSDLGYALLLSGDLEGAKLELLTAQDLDPEDRKAALNLLLLFYRVGDAARADAVVRRYKIGEDEGARLRERAAALAEQGEKR